MKYCSRCGSKVASQDRPGDRAPRYACPACRSVFYLSPRLVAACLATFDGRVLLCKRGVNPSYGLWTLPSGFLERGEAASRAVVREALEEAQVTIELGRPYALFHIPHANQMQIVFLAQLRDAACGAGSETLEAKLFAEPDVPWSELAFASTRVVLRQYFGDLRSGKLGFHFADVVQL